MFSMLAWLTGVLVAGAPGEVPGDTWARREAKGTLDGREVAGEVRVLTPAACSEPSRRCPLVVALHGWGHTPALFAEQGGLAALAARHGVVVAIPDTGRSVFETAFHPETKNRWKKAPGARWIGEVVVPWLRANLNVSADARQTAILGYSTGGRGAFVVAQRYPLVGFVGSVSGTYELASLAPKTGEYRIHAAIYGSLKAHAARWRGDDVVASGLMPKLAGLHLYAAHGDADKVVPVAQLAALERGLDGVATASRTIVVTAGGGHDWALWNAHWGPMFESFAQTLR
jgi:S-formylglutathione hydrolase FrmB